jgi:hypothetical protein
MSIRIEINDQIAVEGGNRHMVDATVYATTAKEVSEVDTSRFVMGSMLLVIDEGKSYMLDDDGAKGRWRDRGDGSLLEKGGDA